MTAADFSTYAIISLGSNLPSGKGDCLDTLAFAANSLAALSDLPVFTSSVYRTSPVDSPAGTPDFYNMAAALLPLPDTSPLALLHELQAIETAADRKRSGIRNEARTLDIDLITFGKETCDTPELILPHPRAHERRFVLEPVMEVVGKDFVLPGMAESLHTLCEEISDQDILKL